MVGHHLSIPGQPPFSRVLITPIAPYAVWHICVDHIQLWAIVVCKLLSETIVVIMPTIIQPVIIENIIQFSGLGLPHRENVENYWSVTGCNLKVLRYVCESSSRTQGLCWHLLKTITSKEDRALLRILRWKNFLSALQNQGGADQVDWMPCRFPYGPRAFSGSCISPKTSRRMTQTDYSWPPPRPQL